MKDFSGKLAVITGGGTGMGRELAKQLIAEGCDVAICDVIEENMAETLRLCESEAPQGIRITAHKCDVSNEDEVKRFRDDVLEQHGRIRSIFCLTTLVSAPGSALLMATELNGSAPLTFAGTAFTTVPAPSFLISLLPTKHI